MKKIIVVGAGGHARAVGNIIKSMGDLEIFAFIDEVKKDVNEKIEGVNVVQVSSIINYLGNQNQINHLIMAIGDNLQRKELFNKLKALGYQFINVIHPSAIVADNVIYEEGIVVGAGVVLGSGVIIEENIIINNGVIVDHESIVGRDSHLAPGVNVAGRVKIGENVMVGIGSSIIDNINIGDNVIIGAGSVVLDNVPSNSKVAGVPAKIIK